MMIPVVGSETFQFDTTSGPSLTLGETYTDENGIAVTLADILVRKYMLGNSVPDVARNVDPSTRLATIWVCLIKTGLKHTILGKSKPLRWGVTMAGTTAGRRASRSKQTCGGTSGRSVRKKARKR
jgi:hypothetical protein